MNVKMLLLCVDYYGPAAEGVGAPGGKETKDGFSKRATNWLAFVCPP